MKVEQDIVAPYRIFSIVALLVITFGLSLGLCFLNEFYLDEILCVAFIDAIFLAIFTFEIEYERKKGMIGNNTESKLNRVMIGYVLCALLIVGFTFMPEFLKPVLIIPIFMCAFSNEHIGFIVATFLCLLLAVITGIGSAELISYLLQIVIGATLSKALSERKFRPYISFICFCTAIIIPCIFYYWNYKEIPTDIYIYSLVEGLVICLVALLAYYRIAEKTQNDYNIAFSDIIQDDFPLVLEAKAYSKQEYVHCQRVSVLCYRIAKQLNYNADLCAAAGFYYRMGRRIGQPYVENGVLTAKKYCFPTEVVEILAEYGGEERKPSSPESAIIHMVDSLLIKLELFDQDLGQSHWNRDMVVYQTLNELSNTGMYDESGMSMNQFLKLRDYLVKEDHLY